MAWIRVIGEDEADGPLQKVYDQIRDPDSGRVDHILSVHSLGVPGMRAHLGLYRSVMTPSEGLSRAEREMIAWTVSRANQCHY